MLDVGRRIVAPAECAAVESVEHSVLRAADREGGARLPGARKVVYADFSWMLSFAPNGRLLSLASSNHQGVPGGPTIVGVPAHDGAEERPRARDGLRLLVGPAAGPLDEPVGVGIGDVEAIVEI